MDFPEFFKSIPKELINFVITTVFSLIIGLSQRKIHSNSDDHKLFGTDRTFSFIGILGFILLVADPDLKYLYISGGFAIVALLAINYVFKIKNYNDFGVTSVVIALITYSIPLLLFTQPLWLFLLIMVTVIIFTELKETFLNITEKFDRDEFLTLAKFIIMAGLILPNVPNKEIFPGLPITPYKVWLAVVVISSISYISYLLKKFVFKDAGIILSGILGGLYSSTATTVVLARKISTLKSGKSHYLAALIMATGMMYIRALILVFIFNKKIFQYSFWAFGILIILCFLTAIIILLKNKKDAVVEKSTEERDRNPLEIKVAIIFTFIFVLFTFLTQFALKQYGNAGLSILSFIVGIVDIDPFLLNVLQIKYEVSLHLIVVASFQAIISNNIAKAVYACFFSGRENWKTIILLFSVIIGANIILLFFL